jgi:hypothetical protein
MTTKHKNLQIISPKLLKNKAYIGKLENGAKILA